MGGTEMMEEAAGAGSGRDGRSGKQPPRRSSRISRQAKPTPGLLAAKKNAMKSIKKQPEFSFIKDIYQQAREAKEMVLQETGFVFDNRMTQHECIWDPQYPECPQRLTSIFNRCKELGLVEKCRLVEPRMATEAEVLTVHTLHHLNLLKSTKDCHDLVKLEHMSSNYDSVYIHPSTYECSLLAAGCTLQLVDEICNKKIQNGMALIRPPGHHAMVGEYNGYCFLNNVALGAKRAIALGMKRVLIVDWDIHHGQGTQSIFYNDPRVLYFSIHRYDHGEFWPNLRASEFDQTGTGHGAGYNMNVPLNKTAMSDADYLTVFHQVLMKVAYEFQPEMVIVSAGYDAAIGCPEGEMEVTPACYAHMISCLMSLACGRVAVILEGGYCLKSLSEGAALTLRALLGEPCPSLGPLPPPCTSMEETVLNVISVQRKKWKFLNALAEFKCSGEAGETPQAIVDDEEQMWNYGQVQRFHTPVPRYDFKNKSDSSERFETRDCYPVQSNVQKQDYSARIDKLIACTKLFSAPHKVCLVYDSKMMDHKNSFETHHIEKPQRIASIFKMHEDYDLIKRLHILESRVAKEKELLRAHSKNHLSEMKNLSKLNKQELDKKKAFFQSVYFHEETFNAASLAAGCLLQVVDSVLSGESGSGVAVVRPPGHHADIDEPCGFCIFNSVAVAAHYAVDKYKLSRVLIVDWDVHHGNGTQEIFFEESSVLYISVHRFDKGEFFPTSCDGAANLVGRDKGEGFNVNIPWNQSGIGNAEYVAAFHQVVLPIAYQFDPELVLVSAGFDAAIGDPLGGCKVTPEAFGHMTHWLKCLAGGRIILCLEGGYNVNSISYSMTMCTKALLGDPLPPLSDVSQGPCESALKSLREVTLAQAKYWPCLDFLKAKLPIDQPVDMTKNEDDVSHRMKTLLLDDTGGGDKGGGTCQQTSLNRTVALNKSCDRNGVSIKVKNSDKAGSGSNKTQPSDSDEQKGDKKSESSTSGGSSSNQDSPGPSSSRAAPGDAPTTLQGFLQANLGALQNEEMFAVVPLNTCPHLPEVGPLPESGIDITVPCTDCSDPNENWICLTCYSVRCGRYINEHMMMHNLNSSHPLTLSFSDLSVWCYPCQAYIDNQVLYAAKNAVHIHKFGNEMPWSYGITSEPI